ncbi:MAG: hypothetical protein QXP01_01090, partial [Candidatus Hadarchaeum sp.]
FDQLTELFSKVRTHLLERLLEEKMPNLSHELFVQPQAKLQEGAVMANAQSQKTILVRFLQDYESFLGPELEVYGPFKKEEMANVPAPIAELLIAKGIAQKIG